jgi:predicted nucleic acid-binding protein
VNEQAVADSTCLIGLDEIGQVDILSNLFSQIYIPPEVAREIGAHGKSWLSIQPPANLAFVNSLKLVVDDGEAEAIALASEKNCRIILDDAQARAIAKRLNLRFIGTAGILVRAKQAGIIPLVKPLLDELERKHFYLGEEIKKETLRLCGE